MWVIAGVVGAIDLYGPGRREAGPSLDEQQQTWEKRVRDEACDSYKAMGGTYVALDQAMQDLSTQSGDQVAAMKRALGLQNGDLTAPTECVGPVFERHAQEIATKSFPESPEGMAGQTTVPIPR